MTVLEALTILVAPGAHVVAVHGIEHDRYYLAAPGERRLQITPSTMKALKRQKFLAQPTKHSMGVFHYSISDAGRAALANV